MSETQESEVSAPPAKKGLARLFAATRYSLAGIIAAFRSEEAFRIEVFAFIVLAPVGVWIGETDVEKVMLVGVLVLVMLVELLNTAIEAIVDRFGIEYHDLSRIAKDCGGAAVAISVLFVFFVWGMLLL